MNVAEFRKELLTIIDAYPRNEHNSWIFEMYLPVLKQESISEAGNLLYDLFSNLDLSNLNIIAISFYNKIIESTDSYYIGFIDTNKIVIDKKSEEVLLLSEDDDLLFYLARNLSDYLEILILLGEYSIQGYFGHSFTDLEKESVLVKCKEVLKREKYFPYYEISFS
jgi:hypothetical protein